VQTLELPDINMSLTLRLYHIFIITAGSANISQNGSVYNSLLGTIDILSSVF